jgi:primosomal protein N' (replication factor Y)
MISKGLNFENVSLVGVINSDSALLMPDFRSSERTFELLTQTGGRTGRYDLPGDVVIQTYNKEHYSIELSSRHDYISFYKEEMQMRKMLKYSPYYYMTLISITSKDYNIGFEESGKIGNYLKSKLNPSTIILGPTTASMFKINNIYHYQIILKYQKDNNLYDTLKFIDSMYKNNSKVKVEFDFDPIRI